jgi:hypothetical protein
MSIAKNEPSCKVAFFLNRLVAVKSWPETKISPILNIIVTIPCYSYVVTFSGAELRVTEIRIDGNAVRAAFYRKLEKGMEDSLTQ